MTNVLAIPEMTYETISAKRYRGLEYALYYLSREIAGVGTVPLCEMPVAKASSGLTVTDDRQFLDALACYLDSENTRSAVLLHFHPINGPSGDDARIMVERFNTNNRLDRYGIFVGPTGPAFYETDGVTVFPKKSGIKTIPDSPQLASLRQRTLEEFLRILRPILGRQ